MIDFDRKDDELPPFLYNIGDKIMGYYTGMGNDMLVGGEIIERKQSTSHLTHNEYNVKLEPELCEGCEEGKVIAWWIDEDDVKPFKQDAWNKAVIHWLEYGRFKKKVYLEHVRMHMALREEPDDISDDMLEKVLAERHRVKG